MQCNASTQGVSHTEKPGESESFTTYGLTDSNKQFSPRKHMIHQNARIQKVMNSTHQPDPGSCDTSLQFNCLTKTTSNGFRLSKCTWAAAMQSIAIVWMDTDRWPWPMSHSFKWMIVIHPWFSIHVESISSVTSGFCPWAFQPTPPDFSPWVNVRGEPVCSVMAAGWFREKSGWIGKVEDVKPVLF
jgi:hypothetical protein